ncbi:hypothetical protein PFAG_03116 [Plasmodium falciparum Santa Lucia]|uniref:Uncharacterized protein n=2 Tax=Plasmodium falciparum TaxID=5833 RepID=W7G3N9_PLAFA|nr:hypothetical protein PFNF135_03270 [Plasmodium falciparum NF135/5.C10]EUT84026.1 hypothetical protein PFAG_03116 [Plasmodium falciparum Santa Lucia]
MTINFIFKIYYYIIIYNIIFINKILINFKLKITINLFLIIKNKYFNHKKKRINIHNFNVFQSLNTVQKYIICGVPNFSICSIYNYL